MNWQPIATAPRNRPIMVWIAGDFQYPSHANWGQGEWSLYEKNEGHLSGDDLITHWDEVPEGPKEITPITEQQWRDISGISSTITLGNLHPFPFTGTTTETRQGVARAKDETL
jgi:hypothetical protein